MEQRLSIITLTVSDLATSRTFYKEVFGWVEDEPERDTIAFFQLAGFKFALYPLEEMAGEHQGPAGLPAGFTLAHTVGSPDEVDELYAKLVEAGAASLAAPEKVFWGGYACYVAGPDGEQWEIAHNPFTPVNPDGTFGTWA